MNEPRDTMRGSEESDVPQEEEGRCHTRALDLGAVRAIHRAAQGASLPRRTAEPTAPAPHPSPGLPRSPRLPGAPPPVTPAAGAEPVSSVVKGDPGSVETTRTLEVDYSPASRLRRTRSEKVQRMGRLLLVAAFVGALGLGVYAFVFGKRAGEGLPAPVDSGGAMPAARATAAPVETITEQESPPQTESTTGPIVAAPATASPALATARAMATATAAPKKKAPGIRRVEPRAVPPVSDELPNK